MSARREVRRGVIDAPLRVGIDFKQPQSYLAKGPTQKLARSLGVEIDWQPMASRPLADPPEEMEGDSRGARHRRFRALYFERDLRRYAEAQGLTLGDLRRSSDSSVAGTGLLWARKQAARAAMDAKLVDTYVDLVFDGYWRDGLSIEDEGAIRAVLERAGVPAAGFDPTRLRPEYDESLARWREVSAVEAPAYVVGEEVFIGRAHLPMIEWIYQGRAGAPPV